MKRTSKALLIVLIMIMCVTSLFLVSCGKKYTVTMSSNGTTTQEQVAEGETFALTTPTLADHEFVGWYLSADFAGEPVTEVVATADVTVYAKWEKLYNVTLNLDGGTLATTKVQLKNGESVYNAVKDLVPTKSNAQFDAWMNGNYAINGSLVVNGEDITLTARYKYAYRIELYQANLAGDAYEKAANDIVGYEYAGVEYAPEFPALAGFEPAEHNDAVTSKVISTNASENVYKLYFDRKTITVTFQVDYPNNSRDDNVNITVTYGNSVSVPTDKTYKGYYLYAWENLNGSLVYKTNAIQAATGEDVEPESFIPTESMTLYPVWKEGYTNMFGGQDYIILLEDDAEVCYLARGDVYFAGEYYADDGSFFFSIGEYDTLEGKISKDYDAYYFYDDSRMTTVYHYSNREWKQNIVLTFDSGNGVDYKYTDPETNATTVSEGTYIMENGEYIITFTTGELAGQVVHAILSTITTSAGKTQVFMFRNEVEYENYRKIVRFVVTEEGLSYYTDSYIISFDGYGNATYTTSEGTSKYLYSAKEGTTDSYYLISRVDGQIAAELRITEERVINGTALGYFIYNSAVDRVFNNADGSTLELDGYYTATYTDANNNKFVGNYNMEQTQLLTMIRFYSSKGNRNFSISLEQNFGEAYYFFEEKPLTYAEYLYMGPGSLYYAPLIVIDHNRVGNALIYAYTTTQKYVLVSEGTYSVNASTGLYTYVETKSYEYTPAVFAEDGSVITEGVYNNVVDYSIIKSIVFRVDTEIFTYDSACWYSYTDDSDNSVDYVKTYTCVKDDVTYTIVNYNNALVAYTDEDGTFDGFFYQVQDDIIVLAININGQYKLLPVSFNEDGTFIMYTQLPFTAKEILTDGTESKLTEMKFNGVDTWTYTDGSGSETYVYVGTATKTGQKSQVSSQDIYLFEGQANTSSKTISFEFILITLDNTYYISKYNDEINGTYREKEGEGSLVIDGFNYKGEYIKDSISQTQLGNYYIAEENVICLVVAGASIYFDIDTTNNTFTVRGSESGTYIVVDNLTVVDYSIKLDGYGKLIASKKVLGENDEYELVEIDANGTYTISNGRISLSFNDGARNIRYEGKTGSYSSDGKSYKAFFVYHSELDVRLINENDWSILTIDSYGATTRIMSNGARENGYSLLISESLLYYYNTAGDYACIYVYDLDAGTAVASDYTKRGYYSETLDSLLFTEYGFAVFGGEERLYYTVKNGEVSIYRYDPENENANKYGFVAESFGRFGLTINYEGKLYYQTSGYDLNFAREADTKTRYPITIRTRKGEEKHDLENLSFTPGGSLEYLVKGVVTINGQNYDCLVGSELNEASGEYEVYVSIGLVKFVIDITFKGEDKASYNIVAMKMDIKAYNAHVLYQDFVYSNFLGMRYPDNVGTISLYGTYDVNGDLVENYVTTAFIEESKIFDRNGDLIQVTKGQFTTSGDKYIVTFTAADGYEYRMDFTLGLSEYAVNTYEYNLYSVSRIQTIVTDGYTVKVARSIASKISIEIGDSYSAGFINWVVIEKDGKEYNFATITGTTKDTLTIYRAYNDAGKIIETIYFSLHFEEETENATVKLFKSCTVVEEAVNTIYTADGVDYIDVRVEANKVSYFHYTQYDKNGEAYGQNYGTSDSMYDEKTNTYFLEVGSSLVLAMVSTDDKGNTTIVLDVAVIVKSGNNIMYFTYKDDTLRMIRYNGVYYRPDNDNTGYDELADVYLFTANEHNFIVVETTLADGTKSYTLHEVRYVYAADGTNYIAIDVATNEVVVVKHQNRNKVVTKSTYNESTKTYTLVTGTGNITAKIVDDKVEITG